MFTTIKKIIVLIPFALAIGAVQTQAYGLALNNTPFLHQETQHQLLASHGMSLGDRYAVPSVNTVFRDNILLTLGYMSGIVKNASQVNWDTLHKPTTYQFTLQPGEVFAFHDDVLPQFAGKHIITTNRSF